MSRLRGPHSLRTRLFVGIAATLAVSTVVMLLVAAALTRRSLDHDARGALARQVDLIATQHAANPLPHAETTLGRYSVSAPRSPTANAPSSTPASTGWTAPAASPGLGGCWN